MRIWISIELSAKPMINRGDSQNNLWSKAILMAVISPSGSSMVSAAHFLELRNVELVESWHVYPEGAK